MNPLAFSTNPPETQRIGNGKTENRRWRPKDPSGVRSSFLGHFAHGTALITLAEILRDSLLVEPQPEHPCKIPVAGFLKRSAQVGVAGLSPALDCEQMRQPG